MKKTILLAALAIAGLWQTGCSAQDNTKADQQKDTAPTVQAESLKPTAAILETVSVKKFHEMIGTTPGLQILDVRTPGETDLGIVPGAILININDADFETRVAELAKDKPIAVYCKAGGRSSRAQGIMNNLGFKEIYNVDGGFDAYKAAGFESSK